MLIFTHSFVMKERRMSNISVNLTPYWKEWADARVKSGRYNNVSEVVREALRLLEYQEREREARLRDLHAGIAGVRDEEVTL
ncbi:hypothetical protein CJ255_20315 [Candidatus Viridilinea mediisalina]|uniref:CopG family transcriptional regulator n=2 Tax=Candidatus Viridilinea mediisalina TaxID=2024553 RepID=A0A2A6RDP1_9CHLR|nr:hypothetical protein CJ255_20315 [Candidatus Viridilinea mediisalina]